MTNEQMQKTAEEMMDRFEKYVEAQLELAEKNKTKLRLDVKAFGDQLLKDLNEAEYTNRGQFISIGLYHYNDPKIISTVLQKIMLRTKKNYRNVIKGVPAYLN
jgi:hypothetical protein